MKLDKITDSHCHPTDRLLREKNDKQKDNINLDITLDFDFSEETRSNLPLWVMNSLENMKIELEHKSIGKIVAVSTCFNDQKIVQEFARLSNKVIPGFGIHPWFVHWLYKGEKEKEKEIKPQDHFREILGKHVDEIMEGLLEMIEIRKKNLNSSSSNGLLNLSEWIKYLEILLQNNPKAIIGEIGLDKSFRIPFIKTEMSNMNGLSKVQTNLSHQIIIFKEQLNLAIQFQRPISIHCVKCHGIMLDILKSLSMTQKPLRLCMHSFSGSLNSLKSFIKDLEELRGIQVYFSFSILVNADKSDLDENSNSEIIEILSNKSRRKGRGTLKELIKATPNNRLLIESDYHDLNGMEKYIYEMMKIYSSSKMWSMDETIITLRDNMEEFLQK